MKLKEYFTFEGPQQVFLTQLSDSLDDFGQSKTQSSVAESELPTLQNKYLEQLYQSDVKQAYFEVVGMSV